MSFVGFIIRNLVRQRVRTTLTTLGISLGITTVVALGVITDGLKASSAELITFAGADFMVAQKGASDLSFSTVPEVEVQAIGRLDGVERAEGVLLYFSRVGSNPFFVTFGRDAGAVAESDPPLVAGRPLTPGVPGEVMLGDRAASQLDAEIGDTVTIERRQFTVVGIYDSGNLLEDGGAYAPLATVQEMASKPGTVTAIFVTALAGADPKALAQAIQDEFPTLTTVSSVSEYGRVDQGLEVLDAANIAISVLAVGIGAIGVMNTMVMSVFERTREIGILRAVGWSGGRILRMILGESLLLCVFAAGVGAALGVLASRAVLLISAVANWLEPQYSVEVFARALVVAVVVALVGALYPAFRAVRLTPMDALRYE